MVKEKVTKKKGPPTDSDTEYETGSDGEVYIKPKKSTKKGVTKRNARGRGAANPPRRGRGTTRSSRGGSSSALADPTNPIEEFNADINFSNLENVMVSIICPTRDPHDPL